MRYFNFTTRIISAGLLLVLFLAGCAGSRKKVIKSPPHYSFKDVQISKLDYKLKEISGLAWDSDKDVFYTHYDEAGKIYILHKGTMEILHEYQFGSKGDYEDIAVYNKVPYILRSDGMITKIIIDSAAGTAHGISVGTLAITGKNDFETMYADTARKALIVICKNCHQDDKESVSAFAFYPDSIGFDPNPIYTINASTVESLWDSISAHNTSKFQPSAACIHPKLHKLFIISSAANELVIADLNGKVEGVYELGRKLFPQPEGITFKNNGDMYISNEGIGGKGTILEFRFIP
jgi:uncharacterized protein YjiK